MIKFGKIFAVFFLFLCFGNSSVLSGIRVTCSSIAPPGSLFDKLLKEGAEKIRNEVGVEVVWISGNAFGDDVDIAKALKNKKLDCAILTVNGLKTISRYFDVLELPFLVKNFKEADFLRGRMLTILNKLAEEEGYVISGLAEVGFVYLFSKTPLRKFEDFRGKTFWVWAGHTIEEEVVNFLKKNFGVIPVKANIWDVDKLKKELDIVIGTPYVLLVLGWQNDFKFMMEEPIVYLTASGIMRKEVFDKMDKSTQEKLMKILYEYSEKASFILREENMGSESILLKRLGYQKVKFQDIDELEKLIKEAVWNELVNKNYLPDWLVVSVVKDILKMRLGSQ